MPVSLIAQPEPGATRILTCTVTQPLLASDSSGETCDNGGEIFQLPRRAHVIHRNNASNGHGNPQLRIDSRCEGAYVSLPLTPGPAQSQHLRLPNRDAPLIRITGIPDLSRSRALATIGCLPGTRPARVPGHRGQSLIQPHCRSQLAPRSFHITALGAG